jgi:dTDP-4-amino-4,6-dideoxygalactose transaminase
MSHLFHALGSHPALRVPRPGPDFGHAAYKAYVYLRSERLKEGWNRDRIMIEVANQGVPCFSGSCSEIYLEKAFSGAGYVPAKPLRNAKQLGETSLMFLVHPGIGPKSLLDTTVVLKNTLESASMEIGNV